MLKRIFLIIIMISAAFPYTVHGQVVFNPPIRQQINFPDTPVNQSSVINLTASNNNNINVSIRLSVNPDVFTIEPNIHVLAPNQVGVFAIRFSPRQEGQVQGTWGGSIAFDDAILRLDATPMVGRGINPNIPQIQVVPNGVNLEILEENGQDEGQIIISNTGNALLTGEYSLSQETDWLVIVPDARQFQIQPDGELVVDVQTTENIPENGDYNTTLVILSNDPNRERIEIPINLTVDFPRIVELVIHLNRGWNMISCNLEFLDDVYDQNGHNMRNIFADILDQVDIIKDFEGRFNSVPFEYWGLNVWRVGFGYQVKMVQEADLIIRGYQIEPDRIISLRAGWNMIAYYPEFNITFMSYVFNNMGLDENGPIRLIKDGQGRFFTPGWGFDPPINAGPGMGYQILSDEDFNFRWPSEPPR